jgi:hypothetical protein
MYQAARETIVVPTVAPVLRLLPKCRSGRSNYLPARCLMVADWGRRQGVVATTSLIFSNGVIQPSVSRGRRLS